MQKNWKKSWEPFLSCLLNSTANPAHFHLSLTGLAVLFNRQLPIGPTFFFFKLSAYILKVISLRTHKPQSPSHLLHLGDVGFFKKICIYKFSTSFFFWNVKESLISKLWKKFVKFWISMTKLHAAAEKNQFWWGYTFTQELVPKGTIRFCLFSHRNYIMGTTGQHTFAYFHTGTIR